LADDVGCGVFFRVLETWNWPFQWLSSALHRFFNVPSIIIHLLVGIPCIIIVGSMVGSMVPRITCLARFVHSSQAIFFIAQISIWMARMWTSKSRINGQLQSVQNLNSIKTGVFVKLPMG
jgi:hypothetical protein